MRLSLICLLIIFISWSCNQGKITVGKHPHNLCFQRLATSWDEAIPLGNGMLGQLVWKREDKLRFSLDRADLWDLRPMLNLEKVEWKYSWVYDQWKNNNYKAVQEAFDRPYDELPAPSKIPAGAIEFDISLLGETESVILDIETALCEVKWRNGTRLLTFVHGIDQTGWFRFENLPDKVVPGLIPPAFNSAGNKRASEMSFFDLDRLGYKPGLLVDSVNSLAFEQEGWGGFKYRVFVEWISRRNSLEGCWSISSEFPGWKPGQSAEQAVKKAEKAGFYDSFTTHSAWWKNYWETSSVRVPDSILEKQWYQEMYKFGSAARKDAPPISLQAVWTADNGKLPPWKGDFHNDLNTQLSYWPAYSSNHIDLEEGFINWLWDNRDTFRKYTRNYFDKNGLNVPGVATLTGEPMGGWIQYSFGPTVSAWLSHHFYLHWKYTMDRKFLEDKAYPWIKEVAIFLDELSVTGSDGKRKLPISSSPEIFDNSAKAWFSDISNFDLALIRWTFSKAAELADELALVDEAEKWKGILTHWPDFSIDEKTGFMFTNEIPYDQSHRHFSHLMAFHPLGLIDYSQGKNAEKIIDNTLITLKSVGPDWWCGYSYSWLGNLYARALKGDEAADALRTFATCFCLPNSFHVNGDQTKSGKSKMTYRPFTLEGNFAFASGLQEMLIQSHTDFVRIFPAVPAGWNDISFENLRTEGAFLVSATQRDAEVQLLSIKSEAGGTIKILNPFKRIFTSDIPYKLSDNLIIIKMQKGQKAELKGD